MGGGSGKMVPSEGVFEPECLPSLSWSLEVLGLYCPVAGGAAYPPGGRIRVRLQAPAPDAYQLALPAAASPHPAPVVPGSGRGAGWLPQGPNPFREAMIQVACKNEGHPRGGRGGVVVGPGTELLGKMPHGGPCSAPPCRGVISCRTVSGSFICILEGFLRPGLGRGGGG